MSSPQIVFENIVKKFDGTVAVENLNLEINEGEFLAIMGSSGCGKTTTLRMLAGLETPTEGEIRLNGERINELSPNQRETPLVWQSLALFPFLSVIQNVEFGLKMRGIDPQSRQQKSQEWLNRMEIGELADRSIDQLSGGQKQRVALARALVTEPPVLLLDEPLSALDANLVVRMQGVLSRLQKDLGITFVYVTHSQSEAFAMADRVVIMSKGVIEQVGTPQQVFRKPASRFVAEFVGSNNILAGSVEAIDNENLSINTAIGQIEVSVDSEQAIQAGTSVNLVISADRINLAEQPTGQVNEFQCSVVSEEFIGTVITLLVETSQGIELKIQKQQREIEQFNLHESKPLWVSWPSQDVYILPVTEMDT
ncbi:MAG: spermidine/putrescine transport system ATP-binding protein [Parasphingorhabdus sp.]|jgi:spermidine/putrescine transport system ATP-binding protein